MRRAARAPRPTRPASVRPARLPSGEVAEWSKAPHSKCGVRATVPWVRIPPSPPLLLLGQAPERGIHLPREALDLGIELLELGQWVGVAGHRIGLALEQGSAKYDRPDRQFELAAVIFAAVPHHRGLDGPRLRQLDLEGRADEHRDRRLEQDAGERE